MKKLVSLIMVLVLCLAVGACNTTGPTGGSSENAQAGEGGSDVFKVGYTIQDLSNPIWAAVMQEVEKECSSRGWQLTSVDCGAESGKQITQIENFITSGVNVIVVQPADPNSLEDVVDKAHDKGILMVAHGISFPGADVSYVNENYKAGKLVGEYAGKWITETYGENSGMEVAIFDWPYIKECIDRVDGMIDGLEEFAPGVKVAASASAANVTDGMSHAETILQANPNVKAFLCFGDGGALGACEVLESKGVDPGEYGIFSVDATDEALAKISSDNNSFRMSVNLGSAAEMSQGVMSTLDALFSGTYDDVYYTPTMPVDADNVADYMA